MRYQNRIFAMTFAVLGFALLAFGSGRVEAQGTSGGAASQLPLDQQQLSISQRYERFEQTLLKIVDITRETDPARADLLLRAIGKSRELRISPQLDSIVELLGQDRLGEAGARQDDLVKSLVVVLEILQSEDERARIKTEMERVQDLLKDLDRITGKQKDVRADTERGGEFDPLGKKQEEVERLAAELQRKIAQQDTEANQKASGKKSGESSGGEKKPGEMSDDPKNQDGEKKEEENQDSEKQDPKSGKENEKGDQKEKKPEKGDEKSPSSEKSDSKNSESESSESDPSKQSKSSKSSDSKEQKSPKSPQDQKPSEQSDQESSDQDQSSDEQRSSSQQQQKTPGRDELEKAKKKMEEAIEELKKKQREKASDKQDEALLELQKAKAKLEELLRQLREEELELMLMALEARFRRMLEMEYQVKNGTVKLAELPEQERLSHHTQRAVQLSRDQSAIMLEADNALVLLKEEGSSVAFPEAVIQLRDDMDIVARRLEKVDVGEITLAIEDDVIEGLKELIESLQKELEKLQNKQKQQDQQQQQGEQEDPGLVDQLAEMKLLRSLQQRINRRTRQYSLQIEGEQATEREMIDLLRGLSARQARVFKATYDLSSGKNN